MQVYLATLEGVVTVEGEVDERNPTWFRYKVKLGVFSQEKVALEPDWHLTFDPAAVRVAVLIRNRLRQLKKEEKRLKDVAARYRAKRQSISSGGKE